MSESAILSQGLSLIANSPFKSSLPEEFNRFPDDSNYDKISVIARDRPDLSDINQYLASKSQVRERYYSEIGAAALKKKDIFSAPLQGEIAEDVSSSHLKIKLLTEYALTQVNQSEKLLSLNELHTLQDTLENLKKTKEDIKQELQGNFTVVQGFFSKPTNKDEEWDAVQNLITSNEALSYKFEEISDLILNTSELIYHQYILAFSICYFENYDVDIRSSTQPENDRSGDELLSHIASVAVQRNVILPAPISGEGDFKVEWAKSCLDTLLAQKQDVSNSRQIKTESVDKENEITRLQTALKDLQFAHQYLTRQYEDERNLNTNVMNTHKTKKTALEKQLAENLISLEKANQRSILVEHEKNVLEKTLDEKMKEIYELQKQVALLKIDNLGYIHTNGESRSTGSSPEKSGLSPVSPMTGITLNAVDPMKENKRSKYLSNPKTPLLQQNINTYRTGSPSSPKFNSSISVLRNEFKKMVNDMHTTYKTELEKEKVERKRLEHLLKLYEERDNDDLAL